jgi:hypothetical protein
MQLQVNESGAWRKVLIFDAAKYEQIKAAAMTFATILHNSHSWRIIDDRGTHWHYDRRYGQSTP